MMMRRPASRMRVGVLVCRRLQMRAVVGLRGRLRARDRVGVCVMAMIAVITVMVAALVHRGTKLRHIQYRELLQKCHHTADRVVVVRTPPGRSS